MLARAARGLGKSRPGVSAIAPFLQRLDAWAESSVGGIPCADPLRSDRRWMGTKMVERSPGELHTYNINKEGSRLVRRFKGIQPATHEAGASVSMVLRYFLELIEDNPITITSRNAAAMFIRIGRAETIARMGDWWFEESQSQALKTIGALMHKQIFRCTSGELAEALWGISFLGPKVMHVPISRQMNMDSLIHDTVNRLLRDISKLRSMDLTLFVEALARLQYRNIDFAMKAITHETKLRLLRFNDSDLPRYLWSLAQLGYPSRDGTDRDDLLSALAWECKKRLDRWNGLELARVIWAFGVLRFTPIQHLLSIACSEHIQGAYIKADAAVKLIWGLDVLNHHPGKMTLVKLGRCFANEVQNLLPRDIVTGFVSLLNFGLVDDRVPTRTKELILRNEVEEWSPREAANVLWALARADFLEQDVFMVLRRFMLQCEPEELSHQSRLDIYRCYLHLHMFRPTMARLLPASLGESCQAAWMTEQSQQPISPISTEVMEKLQEMGYDTQSEHVLHDGRLFAHTASKDADAQFAVEILHPPKCFINDTTAISDQQLWREDLLMSWGRKILRVDEKRWNRLQSEEDKTDLLNMLIKRA